MGRILFLADFGAFFGSGVGVCVGFGAEFGGLFGVACVFNAFCALFGVACALSFGDFCVFCVELSGVCVCAFAFCVFVL